MKSFWIDVIASFETAGADDNPSKNGKFTLRPFYPLSAVILLCNIALVNPTKRPFIVQC